MTKPATFTQATLKRAIKAAQAAGLHVIGIRADGTVLVDNASDSASALFSPTPARSEAKEIDWDDIQA